MNIITTVKEMQTAADHCRAEGKRIGIAPTMGYLHDGHMSLLRIMRKKCDIMVMSIFVNPTQFGAGEDFDSYPRDFERDRKIAEKENVDIIFAPSSAEMYPSGSGTFLEVPEMGNVMCGKFRPGHFRGVTTIVAKLFHCAKPHIAIFGQKDAQQAAILRRMSEDLLFDIEIIIGPTLRETDGLAMSSRNIYLTPDDRKEAVSLSQALFVAERLVLEGETQSSAIIEKMTDQIKKHRRVALEYISIADPLTLTPIETIFHEVLIALAARVGKARLIDNILVSPIKSKKG